MSWGTSSLIFSHYINWPFDPNLSPAPPFIPLSTLQPKSLSVHNRFTLLEGLMGRFVAFWKSKIRCHHIGLYFLFLWMPLSGMIFHTLPGLIDDSLGCCGCCSWLCLLLLVTCWLSWSGWLRWGKNLENYVWQGKRRNREKSPFFSLLAQYLSACHDVISEIKAEVGIDSRHSWQW